MSTIGPLGAFTASTADAVSRAIDAMGYVLSTRVYVDPAAGNDYNTGLSPGAALGSIAEAVARSSAYGQIVLFPGQYDEALITIGRSLNNLVLVGAGGRGAAYIEPSTEDQGGMVVHADDVTLVNVGVAGEDTTSATALIVTGARFRAVGCKFEGGAVQVLVGPGTDAQITAGTRGTGADALFDDCEICWGTTGIKLQGTDYGGCTQTAIRNCRFHDLTAASLEEGNSGGSADVQFFGLDLRNSVFEPSEDGSIPTKYVSLNDNNANSGIVTGCQFPNALNSGNNLCSTKVLWTGNFHPAGLSTTQPS